MSAEDELNPEEELIEKGFRKSRFLAHAIHNLFLGSGWRGFSSYWPRYAFPIFASLLVRLRLCNLFITIQTIFFWITYFFLVLAHTLLQFSLLLGYSSSSIFIPVGSSHYPKMLISIFIHSVCFTSLRCPAYTLCLYFALFPIWHFPLPSWSSGKISGRISSICLPFCLPVLTFIVEWHRFPNTDCCI